MKHILLLVLGLILGGCASDGSTKPHASAKVVNPNATTVWRLTFDKRLEQNDFAAPIVNVDFGDETLPFLVDTAATSHVIDQWAAKLTGLPVENDRLTTAFEIDDDKMPAAGFTVAKLNSRYEDSGVAGSLSPQLLMGDKAIALDFLNSKFHRGDFDALMADRNAEVVTAETGKICPEQGPAKTNLYVLTVKIDNIPLKLLVDSNAEETAVIAGHAAAMKLSKEGKSNFSRLHKGKVTVGGKTVTRMVDILDMPNLPCGVEGVLGMDVLKLCTLVIDQKRMGLRCNND